MPVLKNARHEKFVQCLIAGMSQRKAYREAFKQANKWKDSTVDSRASEMMRVSEVLGRYQELQEQAQDEAIMTRKERMVKLSELAKDAEKEDTQIKAIDILNKMDSVYVVKQETQVTGQLNVNNPYDELTADELRALIGDG